MKIVSNQGKVIVTQSSKEIEKIPQLVNNFSLENADLFFQNAIQDLRIDQLEEENANLMLIIAGGGL